MLPTLEEAANQLVEAIHPVMADGVIAARYDLGGEVSRKKPWRGRLVRPKDRLDEVLQKILQVLDGATCSNGNFYVILGDLSEPYVEPVSPKPEPPPTYRPPGERRYWHADALRNPNPAPNAIDQSLEPTLVEVITMVSDEPVYAPED